MDAPRDGLTRTMDFTITRADEGGDGLTLEGYGAVFNTPTRIDSWEGRFDEVIAPGAFKKTLSERGHRVIMQFDHGQHPLIGSLPIGAIDDLREDARGLFVRARLFDNDFVKPVRDAIEGGAIQGMSFRFSVVADQWSDDDVPVRTVQEVRLFEVGPVVHPAYEATTVGVRAAEVAQQLSDPDFRKQVARALLEGTSNQAADAPGDEAADTDDAAPPARRDRSQDHMTALERITAHLPKEGN